MNSAAATTDVASKSRRKSSTKSKTSKQQQQPSEVDLEELVSNAAPERNWRGIVIALLVIVSVLGLIITAIVLVTPRSVDEVEKAKMNFKDFIRHEYEPRVFHPVVLPEGDNMLFMNYNGEVEELDCTTNNSKVIMNNSTFRDLNTYIFKFSYSRNYVLLPYDIQEKFRYSTISRYKVYNMNTKSYVDLEGPRGDSFEYVTWSPKTDSLICVQYNDIFYLRDIKNMGPGNFEQYTFDGELDQIYNGVPDWIYEEEILSSDNALWWSPNGTRVLYGHFDETEVYRYDLAFYGDMTESYVDNRRIPYPKAGTPNPKVTLKIINFENNSTTILIQPKEIDRREHYFTTVTWQDEEHVLVTWLNRAQNMSIISICSAKSGKCRSNHRVECNGGWVDIFSPAVFTTDKDSYFLILSQNDGAAGSFRHIAKIDSHVDLKNRHRDGSKTFLTAGKYDVTRIVGYDDELKLIYFIATKMGDPTMRHLYSTTTLKDHKDFRKTTCMSCDISKDCQYVDATFTSSGKYYVLACKGPAVPSYHLYSIEDGFIKTLENNKVLKEKLAKVSLPEPEYVKIPINDDEYMWSKLLLPPVLKKDEIITYEILFKVYGSPGSQKVTEEFSIGWEHYLASVHNVIIAYVDGRGTGARGDNWLFANYKHLGTTEVEDTLKAAKYYSSLHYVNEKSATIWGMSYGGFLTASVLAQGDGLFKCGVAVAPVTDWRYYDSVYTERYMGQPTAQDNVDAYNYSNVSKYAENFRKSNFMLIHGTGDDNVHFQNSAQLMKALTENDVYFQSQIYTDESHFLNGGNTQTHMYNSMEDFILNCYGKSRRQGVVEEEVEKDTEEVEER